MSDNEASAEGAFQEEEESSEERSDNEASTDGAFQEEEESSES